MRMPVENMKVVYIKIIRKILENGDPGGEENCLELQRGQVR